MSARLMEERGTLAIFGITGGTGRALVHASALRGWHVRGLARPGSAAPEGLPDVTLVRGTFQDSERVMDTVTGADAVCCAFGPRPPHTDVFCVAATTAIAGAMRRAGCRRLVCQTGAMIGAAENRSHPFEWLARAYARHQPAAARDRFEQEQVVEESGLEWTIVKPPRLTDGPARGSVQAGPALPIGLMSSISRADLASFMLDEIEHPRFARLRVFVKG